MGLDPITKRASELMSKWVGETEQQIAEAFSEARATGAFLIFDEADSFLADRRGASRNWEISQVNEILSQLETHDLPYACTTNLADRLDPAAARRFLFRATFRYLDPPAGGPRLGVLLRRRRPGAGARAHPAGPRRLSPSPSERAEKLGFLDDPGRIAGGAGHPVPAPRVRRRHRFLRGTPPPPAARDPRGEDPPPAGSGARLPCGQPGAILFGAGPGAPAGCARAGRRHAAKGRRAAPAHLFR